MIESVLRITILSIVVSFCVVYANSQDSNGGRVERAKGWKTNLAKRSIKLSEIIAGGPPKDGIPALDKPIFVSIKSAEKWLGEKEPVISLVIDGEARAYPLRILIWHEIINHEFKGIPVSITFCPLCYSAIAFDRRLDGKVYSFGVSGMIRHSDMVMFDRETESWWQQITGEAIVGDLVGKKLKQIPAQIVGFGQFVKAYPEGLVVSQQTGYIRDYGRNPYVGYDNINQKPYFPVGQGEGRLRPMEKLVVVQIGSKSKVYPYRTTRKLRVINDKFGSTNIVVFHVDGARSALDAGRLNQSKDVGTTGVFVREIDGIKMDFRFKNGLFIDNVTNSSWNIFGQAIEGKFKGKRLKRIQHGDYFAFAWLTFKPKTEIYCKK